MASKPAVVVLHGAWHQPSHFDPLLAKLRSQGYETAAPATASAADVAVDGVFGKDVAIAKTAIRSFTDQGKNVVVVMHSYGGVYGSEAVAELFEESKSETGSGRVVHLFYVAAIILEKGTSVMDDNCTPHAIHVQDGLLHNLEPYNRFYATTPPDVAWRAISLVKPQAAESFATKMKYSGWADYNVPITYLACDQDQALLLSTDTARFIGRLEAAGLKDYTLRRIDCDHSPWLSAENEFLGVVSEVLQKASSASKL